MNRTTTWLAAILAVGGCASEMPDGGSAAAPASFRVDRTERAHDGVPYFVRGTLGAASSTIHSLADVDATLARVLPEIGRAIQVPADQLVAHRVDHDELGMTHVRYAQRVNGLPVVGGTVIVHVAADGAIRSVTNGARDASTLPARPQITSTAAVDVARTQTPNAVSTTAADLVYVITNGEGDVHLAWRTDVRAPLLHDTVFVDALSGEIVARHPHIQPVKNRTIHTGGDVNPTTGIPAPTTRAGTEGSPPTEVIAKTAFDNTGITYDCFNMLFGRDSYDGAGAGMVSYVHATDGGAPMANAFWQGSAMVFGDGDGVVFAPLVRALDVTAHELAHGLTQYSAGLVYQNEPGALNEATSDVFGAACEAFKVGSINANTWLVGEDIFTPNRPNDALRYMHNPMLDAPLYNPGDSSTDYYPERHTLRPGEQPNPGNDYGGVHKNSGIANLAFYLMSQGGKHPRNKTPHTVTGIGIEKASRIWYRALTTYFTENQTFAQARVATERAAMDLYPGSTKTVISMAWATVGVGTAPVDNSPPTIAITSPTKGASVQAGFTITADASDDQGVLRVDFSIDGQVVGSAAEAPYTFTSATLAFGAHTVEATAYDAVNRASDTAMVTLVDPTCGNTCSDDEICDMNTGTCIDDPEDGGGCCSTSDTGAVSSMSLFAGLALLLRRRRRS